MALLAEQIPEQHRKLIGLVVEAHILGALDEIRFGFAARGNPGEIALNIGGEDRNARPGKALGQHLQCHRLAGTGRAGSETMTIGERKREVLIARAFADKNFAVSIRACHLRPVLSGF